MTSARIFASRREQPATARGAGFTLLEFAVYSAITVVLGAPLISVLLFSSKAVSESDAFNKAAERNRTVLFRVSGELRRALMGTVSVTDGDKTLLFTLPAGYNGTAVIPGSNIRYELALMPGEAANALDDNGNGLIDEGQLLRRDLTTGVNTAVASGIDLAGSGFALAGSSVTVTISNMGYLPDDGSVYSVSRNVTVTPRN